MSKSLSNVLKGTYTASLPASGNTGNILISSAGGWVSSNTHSSLLVGPTSAANYARFPNALSIISNTAIAIQQNENHNIGLIAEGTANSGNNLIYGIGVYGVGYTNGGTRSGGVVGEGHVTSTNDSGSSIGVRGYANDTHASGFNIGLYGDAAGSSTGNYALAMNNGNILSNFAQTWYLNGNLSFNGAYTVTIPTLSLTNPLSVANGGTGATTLTGILKGNGTNAFTAASAGTDFSAGTSTLTTGILKNTTTTGALTIAVAADFPTLNQNTTGTAGNVTGTVAVGNGGTGATSLAAANLAVINTNNTFTGTQTFTGSSSILATVFTNMVETVTVSATAATGTIAYYTGTQSVLYYTTNAAANWTVNLTHSSGTTLNNAMAIGQAVTVAFAVTQGSPAFYNSAVQVDGSAVTPKWQGGTAPSAGNASSVDVYTYTVIKTGAATFTVLASLTKYA